MMTQSSLALQPLLGKGLKVKLTGFSRVNKSFKAPFSADRPHQAAVKGVPGEVTSDCEGWRAQKYCAHAVALSQQKGSEQVSGLVFNQESSERNEHCQHESQKASTGTQSQGQASEGSEEEGGTNFLGPEQIR